MSDEKPEEAAPAPDAAAPAPDAVAPAPDAAVAAAAQEEISYHAVQKDGNITAIWEMRGRKHLRTIDPRSEEGRHLLGHHEPAEGAAEASHGA